MTTFDEKYIPFNWPYMTGNELRYISEARENGKLAGDGPFTQKCHEWIESNLGVRKALLTHSCTAALEIASLLLNLKEGDEVIMPSYTFVSTANAFVLRGAVPVFIDIRSDTLNMDESKVEAAITKRTRAIVPVHYAGVACEMDTIMKIAQKYNLLVVEDAAQGMMAEYKGRQLGTIGDLAAYSFHETKNIICGEGGALLINNELMIERAEIIREKGTNRSKFFRGQVDKYTWVDKGSSYLPGELTAAFLWAQFNKAQWITTQRIEIWEYYHQAFAELEDLGHLRRPFIPSECKHNGHMYYIILESEPKRADIIRKLNEQGINTVFHYVPLHSSPAGRRLSRVNGSLTQTENLSERLLRLPLWIGVDVKRVVECIRNTIA